MTVPTAVPTATSSATVNDMWEVTGATFLTSTSTVAVSDRYPSSTSIISEYDGVAS